MRNNSLYKFVITSIILILALSVSGWTACTSLGDYSAMQWTYCNRYSNCPDACTNLCEIAKPTVPDGYVITGSCEPRSANNKPLCGDFTGTTNDCNGRGAYDSWGRIIRCTGYMHCDTQAEADSVACAIDPTLPICCDAHCECDKAGGTWHPNGYCVKDCQTEACCDSLNVPQVAYDSVYIWQNNSCALHWRCEAPQAECVAINGLLVADVLPDTTISGSDTTIANTCYFNCSRIIPSDSSKAMVDGNIVLSGSSSTIAPGIKTPNPFDAIRSENNGEYTYDFISPQAEHYLDSIAFTPCVQALYRCVLNGKYAYYYDNQTAPSGCANIVKIK